MSCNTDVVTLFGVLIFVFHAVLGTRNEGCFLNVTNKSTEKLLPVPFYNYSLSHYELVVPYKGVIQLQQADKISLLCPGPKNYLTLTNSNISSISCIGTSTVQVSNKKLNFEDIQCQKIIKSEVLKTKETCGNKRGYIYKIGYQVTKKAWVTLIDICHVPTTGNTLYTQHIIYGKAMKYASKATYRPGFSTSGLNDDITASVAYKKPYQKSTFNKILKSAKLAEKYINGKSYLARGHLSPDADFLLASSQYSTYFYINAAPQWQDVNGGSWKSIESTVRKLSQSYENITVVTGTHDVLTYPDAHNSSEAIFLVSSNKLPVPKYFWKVVYDPDSQKAIVFVILNDPFVETIVDRDIFCKDICRDSGYTNAAWKKTGTGYVFCCDVRDFKKVVDYVPDITVKGILAI